MRHWLSHPEVLFVLTLLPVLAVLGSIDARRRRRVLTSIGGIPAIVAPRRWPQALRGLLQLTGLLALVAGAAGPQWGRDVSQPAAPGRDVIVVLDCSKSMLAETPSRLERARAGLLDLADTFRRVGGHRVALVTFAARARLICPLTHDYDHFRDAVLSLDPETFDTHLGPVNNAASGTRIGLGLIEAMRAGDARFAGAADILLLSDGDDPARDDEWQVGVDAARSSGIPVYTVGIGDPANSSVIPLESHPLQFEGKEVRTRLNEAVLRTIADRTGGIYFSARARPVAVGALYLDAIAARPQREDPDDNLPALRDRSPLFYGASLGLLSGSILLGAIRLSRPGGREGRRE
jgi:Ca-activated chloride channel family protein